jgi:hypothetical protein
METNRNILPRQTGSRRLAKILLAVGCVAAAAAVVYVIIVGLALIALFSGLLGGF